MMMESTEMLDDDDYEQQQQQPDNNHTTTLCLLAWKKRSGFAKFYAKHTWEQRWIVITGTKLLYYRKEEGNNTSNDETMNHFDQEQPRGCMDIVENNVSIQVIHHPTAGKPEPGTIPDTPTEHEVEITCTKKYNEDDDDTDDVLPRPRSNSSPSISSSSHYHHSHSTPPRGGIGSTSTISWKFCFKTQEDLVALLSAVHDILEKCGRFNNNHKNMNDRFEHDFLPGDHIFRWEMIICPPVIYPIQIHGIVLEAGRNAFVIADFGLTGYGRKKGEDFNIHDEHNNNNDRRAPHNIILEQWRKLRPNDITQRLNIMTLTDPNEIRKWFKADYLYKEYSMKKRKKMKKNKRKQQQQNNTTTTIDHHDLPKSDPIEIVLARCHFLLENEHVLPPYHVFYSNSECIAVWCKTGRWSTLQTAVWCATNTVGAAKTSTLTTIGVAAAAHVFLAPVVAVGGLLWVSAPMVILKKSREKWEEATTSLTLKFWQWAPPPIYVAAIEHWSGITTTTTNNNNNNIGQQ